MQRRHTYNSIPEQEYPRWTVSWMREVRRVLKPGGSVAIVIRSHIRNHQVSDYVMRTRLALREAGWWEPEELIWIKPDAPPLGSTLRPRRSWENILWFSKGKPAYVKTKANGSFSKRIGYFGVKGTWSEYVHGGETSEKCGTSRSRDYVEVGTTENERGNPHNAQYPVPLAEWLIRLLCPAQGVVLDPFAGCASTLVAAQLQGRQFTGIELEAKYIAYSRRRLAPQ